MTMTEEGVGPSWENTGANDPTVERNSDAHNNSCSSDLDLIQFFRKFFGAKGTKAIVCITLFLSLGVGCVVGVTPEQIADRYARLNHGYTGPHCDSLEIKPAACRGGTDDAQAAAAWSNLALSLNALLFNPVVGSASDLFGRRPMIMASVFVLLLPCATFLALIVIPTFHPIWYYLSNSLIGAFNYIGLIFAAFSDCMPESLRAQSYGLFIAVFYGGYALAPSLPLLFDHLQTGIASFVLIFLAFVSAVLFLPETLSEQVREAARQKRQNENGGQDRATWSLFQIVRRPFAELSILGKDTALALLVAGSFFSSMVFASDTTLVLFYIEDQLDVGDKDIASMFLMLGIVGLVLQGGAIQPLVQWMGEQRLLIATFACGTLHNALYAMARSKSTIYVALFVSQLTKLNTPVLSSIASKDASKEEQGRIQGALAASNAIAFSLGPLTMEFVYHHTKNKRHMGPGFMFFYAAALYAVGMCLIALVPIMQKRTIGERGATNDPESLEGSSLEEPLLRDDAASRENPNENSMQ